jgi:hypothetical protein
MPLASIHAVHVRVTCDGCQKASAELCAKRELEVTAKMSAVPKFLRAGWHHDAGTQTRVREWERDQRDGNGRWYCPACARKTHL